MDIDAFIQALRAFLHVPELVIEQAVANATAISPENREKLIEELQEVEAGAKKFHDEEDNILEEMGLLVSDAERSFDRAERESVEEADRAKEEAKADKLFGA